MNRYSRYQAFFFFFFNYKSYSSVENFLILFSVLTFKRHWNYGGEERREKKKINFKLAKYEIVLGIKN